MSQAPTQPAPQQPALHGVKGYLANILHGIGEGAKASAGLPTDYEVQQMAFQRQQKAMTDQADILQKQAQAKFYAAKAQEEAGTPLSPEDAVTLGMPVGTLVNDRNRANLYKQILMNQGKTDVQDLKNKGLAGKPQDPIKQTMTEAKTAFDAGDIDTYTKKIQEAKNLSAATKTAPSNEISLILKANNGDADAQKALDVLQGNRMKLMQARGAAMGQGRLYQLRNYMDPETGETTSLTGFDYLQQKQAGRNFIPVGQLGQDKVIAVQQLQSEANPALKAVRDNLGAFDNAGDRAIFARVMKQAGNPAHGDEASWMGNVMNQALKEGLSPQGQRLAVAEGRMAETLGRMRSVLGLQATDSAMALTLRLMPGASTPNSAYAKQQVDTLDSMINKAVEIPAFGKKPQPQQPQRRVIDLTK